jgi:lysophospholipid acyltransferase (LPLAT)-like uncharacterized protein
MASPLIYRRLMALGFMQWLISGLGAGYVMLVKWTSKLDRPKPPFNAPVIIALWHGRLALLHYLRHGNRSLVALISGHRDGQLISKAGWYFDIRTVSGSSNRDSVRAVRELVLLAREGHSLFLTPDGPRGPRMRVNEGIIRIARMTQLPIVPATISTSRGVLMQTWDRFLLPLPFSRIVIRWGEPLHIAHDDTDNGARARLEMALTQLQNQADRAMGRESVDAA